MSSMVPYKHPRATHLLEASALVSESCRMDSRKRAHNNHMRKCHELLHGTDFCSEGPSSQVDVTTDRLVQAKYPGSRRLLEALPLDTTVWLEPSFRALNFDQGHKYLLKIY